MIVVDTIAVELDMKVARPCAVCGEILLSNECKSCGHEFIPETPKPKKKKEARKKPTKPGKGRFLRF